MAETGKHALVTGGGSGIGLAIARALTAAGWLVTIAGRSEERLRTAVNSVPGLHSLSLDVTDAEAVRAAIRALADSQGPVQLLVNNAGGVTSAPFEKTSLESWRQTLDLNLMGAVHCTQAVLPQMRKSGWGRIVNIASTAGLIGFRYAGAYVAAKHAVVGLTKTLALELAKTGITVNAVCPGYTETGLVTDAIETIVKATDRSKTEVLANLVATNPQGRLIKPEEVAGAVLWLASENAAAVTGIALPIAGGEVS